MSFDAPWVLWLLPLALLPLWARPQRELSNAWLAMLPRDRASEALDVLLRIAAVGALAALVIGAAGPYRPEYAVQKVGKGAEIVLVLDRSRSMDQSFAGGRGAPPPGTNPTGPEALEYYSSRNASGSHDSKGKVARQLLSEFAAQRPEDRFGMVVFSTLPIRLLEFTQKPEVIQAAITAGNIGRGLADTDIGLALSSALSYFDDRPYTGSRILMLVSDGGDKIDVDVRERVAYLARKHRVAIYWFYIRSNLSPGLMADASEPPSNADTVPEYFLHRFFASLGTPYKAYEAENPEALQKAIDDVNRLENLPITYLDTVPRRDLSQAGYGIALACVLAVLGANLLEIKRWS
ncbi:MAG: VWA domain-containing protein [Pseudomonadota bacterium]|nr:VWA domain-containing protein [Pseudomonadota bacterium]